MRVFDGPRRKRDLWCVVAKFYSATDSCTEDVAPVQRTSSSPPPPLHGHLRFRRSQFTRQYLVAIAISFEVIQCMRVQISVGRHSLLACHALHRAAKAEVLVPTSPKTFTMFRNLVRVSPGFTVRHQLRLGH